jgi:sensor histidine kinase YesM
VKPLIRVLEHAILWIAAFCLIIYEKPNATIHEYMYWIWILFNTALVVYCNLFILLDRFFYRKKYLFYAISLVLLILTASSVLFFTLPKSNSFFNLGFFQHIINFVFVIILTSSVKFFREQNRKQSIINKLENSRLQTEVMLLKSQVNPHFLFNMLNNIYAVNLSDSNTANEMILQLSDILRFQLEASNSASISLSKEIEFVENYILLEKIRLNNTKVEIAKSGNFENFEITPLLVLPLVENAFKYGKNKFYFSFTLTGNEFIFIAENEKRQQKTKKYSGGLGIENVKKRLELEYKNRFDFKITETNNIYNVELIIKL